MITDNISERNYSLPVADPFETISGTGGEAKANSMGTVEEYILSSKKEETIICPFCKKHNDKKYKICIYCGMTIPIKAKEQKQ